MAELWLDGKQGLEKQGRQPPVVVVRLWLGPGFIAKLCYCLRLQVHSS